MMSIDMAKVDITLLIVVSQKMKAHINVFGLGVQHGFLSNANRTRTALNRVMMIMAEQIFTSKAWLR